MFYFIILLTTSIIYLKFLKSEGWYVISWGLVGVIFFTYLFSNFKNLNYRIYLDTISCVALIGIFLGRIANFINGELYGTPTEKAWE